VISSRSLSNAPRSLAYQPMFPAVQAYPDYYGEILSTYQHGPLGVFGGPWVVQQPMPAGPLSGDPRVPDVNAISRAKEDRASLSAWGRLCRGQGLGKKSVLAYNADAAEGARQRSQVNILQVSGDDMDAQHLTLTIAPPLVIPQPFTQALIAKQQNVTGEQDNQQITSGNFPGIGFPIAWPPFNVVIEWGIGGNSFTAEVDFTNGTTVNLPGVAFVRAYAVADPDRLQGTSALYTLFATIGPGMARPGSAQKTVFYGNVASAEESTVFPIPKFAKRAIVVGWSNAAAPNVPVTVATLRFWQSPTGQASGTNVGNFVATGNQPIGFDVPGGAYYASLVNGMSSPARFAIVYELSI